MKNSDSCIPVSFTPMISIASTVYGLSGSQVITVVCPDWLLCLAQAYILVSVVGFTKGPGLAGAQSSGTVIGNLDNLPALGDYQSRLEADSVGAWFAGSSNTVAHCATFTCTMGDNVRRTSKPCSH